uniref:BEACH domain-containing protein n=1 Tax=Ciona savignyi TaxID=51511 RepID=H2YJ53_CIOSA
YIIKPFITHSVQHALMYSPNMLSQSNSKPLFLVYQLLQLFTSLSDSNPTQDLCCLSWSDIALDDPLWLRANLCRCDVNNADKKLQLSDEILQSADDKLENPPQSINTIGDVVDQWVCGKMSNFDYLMYLNKLAGRRSKDPHHHPILPWVSDLSSSHGGWRDLTKSKYRLNKGDDQLYLQYAMAAENSGAQVPHHVPDMLSDITYYVYMARRMSREVLQKHVRSYWEPNEYPSTVQRIQEWSPDECIPEFYTDPSVFHSIHPDMNDLGLPEWSQSPQQFVIQHMEMLESPQVSSKLHEWVDVTFGYKLRGRHAEEAMNVCRQLVDDHRDPHTHGIVQLFSAPHPQKRSPMDATLVGFGGIPYIALIIMHHDHMVGILVCMWMFLRVSNIYKCCELAQPAKILRHVLVLPPGCWNDAIRGDRQEFLIPYIPPSPQQIGEMRAGDDMMVDERNEAQKLSLPPDYNPFQWLDQLEKILCFKSSNTECASLSKTFCEVLQRDNDEKTKCSVAEFVSDKNTIVFLCLALELYLAPHMHCVVDDLPLSKRFQAVHACYNAHKVELPSVIRYPVEYILKALADTVPGLVCDNKHGRNKKQIYAKTLLMWFITAYFIYLRLFLFHIIIEATIETSYAIKTKYKLHDINNTFLPPSTCAQLAKVESSTKYDPTIHHRLFKLMTTSSFPPPTSHHLLTPSMHIMHFPSILPCSLHIPALFDGKYMVLYVVERYCSVLLVIGVLYMIVFIRVLVKQLTASTCKHLVLPAIIARHYINTRYHLNQISNSNILNRNKIWLKLSILIISNSGTLLGIKTYPTNILSYFVFEKVMNHLNWYLYNYADEKQNILPQMTTDHYTTPLHEHNFPDVIEMLHELLQLLHDHIEGFHILVPHIIQLLHQPLPHNVQFLIISFDKLAQELGKWVKSGIICFSCKFQFSSRPQRKLQTFASSRRWCLQSGGYWPLGGHKSHGDLRETLHYPVVPSSLQWIIMKFGPTLTSKYIARHLLGFLNACFLYNHGIAFDFKILFFGKFNFSVHGGRVQNHQSLIDCLIFAASMYGASYFTLQYIPHLSYNVSSAISGTKFTPRASAALDATTTVLLHLVPYWTDQILMDQLSRLSKEIILPLIGVLASKKFSFPYGGTQRKALCLKTVKVVVTIAVRIGRDMARQRMTGILQSFFRAWYVALSRCNIYSSRCNIYSRYLLISCFTLQHDILFKDKSLVNTENDEKIIAEISETFCPETAYHAYVPFTRLMGGFHMERILNPNHDVIWKLSSKFENRLAEHGGVGNKVVGWMHGVLVGMVEMMEPVIYQSSRLSATHPGSPMSPQYHIQEATGASGASPSNITMVGNQIVFHEANEARPNDPHDPRDPCDPNDETKAQRKDLNENENCQLTGNWLAYWEHEIGLPDTDNHIHFNQIDLQSFAGHSGAVRSMCVNNSEEWFVTGGKDKMVKIWSLHTSTCDTIQPSFTYRGHKKTPSHISILESDNTILTCDGSVHVWDPYTGQMVVTFDSSEFKSGIVSMTALPSPQRAVLAANSDAFIKLIDVRSQYVAQEYKTTVGASVGVVRTMCTNGNWVAVGFSSGFISLIDVRMGPILRMWQAHDSDITTSCVVGDHFLTASMDQTIAHWDTTSTKPRMVYRSITEPVTMVRTYHNEVISGSTSNRINISRMARMHYDKPTTVTKLRSDTLKGTLSTFCILPMKRQLLMASDSGSVKLLA